MKKILVLIDCQNDFITGSLAVKEAEYAMQNLEEHITRFHNDYDKIIITADKHPHDHCSFIKNGGEWPEHCVVGTNGAEIYESILSALNINISANKKDTTRRKLSDDVNSTFKKRMKKDSVITTDNRIYFINKGESSDYDMYSAFHPELMNKHARLDDYLLDDTQGDIIMDVAGLAGDYCVLESIKDIHKYYSHVKVNILDKCIASVADGMGNTELRNYMVEHYPKQIINHFTDNDFYTFTCQYFALRNFPRTLIKYKFFDRNKTKYPQGFGKLLQWQVNQMKNVTITEEEIAYMKQRIDFLPDWYYTYLRGFRFNPEYVHIEQDNEGYLDITITGPWHETIVWEMPILASVSELYHYINGHYYTNPKDINAVHEKAYNDAVSMITNGLRFADMGTRRRYSFEYHDEVLKWMCKGAEIQGPKYTGRFLGTSNVYFAMKYNLQPIGTMSHQCISLIEGLVASPFEANHTMMKLWAETFNGNCGIYLYDCFGDKLFFDNLSLEMALLYSGLRQDSGDEKDQTEKICAKYKSLNIDPSTKSVVYSNALDKNKAIELHKWIDGRVQDSYGIGTYFTGKVKDYAPMNIVIKAVEAAITEKREWHHLVKLSCDAGKTLGNQEKCDYLISLIKQCTK